MYSGTDTATLSVGFGVFVAEIKAETGATQHTPGKVTARERLRRFETKLIFTEKTRLETRRQV